MKGKDNTVFTRTVILLLIAPLSLLEIASAFTVCRSPRPLSSLHASAADDKAGPTVLDVVLFGVGDCRVADHVGLAQSLNSSSETNVILPMAILDTADTLVNIPMAISHPRETAALLYASLKSLNDELMTRYDMNLHVHHSINCTEIRGQECSFIYLLKQVLQLAMDQYNLTTGLGLSSIRIHVCDLGLADTAMRYNPYSILQQDFVNLTQHIDIPIQLCPWTCTLHEQAWTHLLNDPASFPERFDHYQQSYLSQLDASHVQTVVTTSNFTSRGISLPTLTYKHLPPLETFTNAFVENSHVITHPSPTGLYMTHWGGLNIQHTMNEASVQDSILTYLGQQNQEGGDHVLLSRRLLSYTERNFRSLEHASIDRLLIKDSADKKNVQTNNLIEGEILTRFLAAPLLFGIISIRHIWYLAQDALKSSPRRSMENHVNIVKNLCQDREWYTLLATKQLLSGANVKYWRWHGFLCRYSLYPIISSSKKQPSIMNSERKHAIVLVHGFGASGSQFNQTTQSLAKNLYSSLSITLEDADTILEVPEQWTLLMAAPDLIGFGQSEKPSLTYTQYLWESFVASFTQDIILNPHSGACDSFVIGGNSIGGYTAMAVAADDSRHVDVTSSGAFGSSKCTGLILMNSAGRLYSREELLRNNKNQASVSVTEATALDMLGSSSPLPRWIASLGGQLLLSYLRPRIQSICTNLYPTNPMVVKESSLCSNILRDSLDPGALNVMISGTKLPPPRTANELLGSDFGSVKKRQYETLNLPLSLQQGMFEGPVLIAQGILDPLNDAKGRARMFGDLRSGIDVEEINAGHCPHDELPNEVANAIIKWLIARDPFDWKQVPNNMSR